MLFFSTKIGYYRPKSPRNSNFFETGSLETPSSSGESGANLIFGDESRQ